MIAGDRWVVSLKLLVLLFQNGYGEKRPARDSNEGLNTVSLLHFQRNYLRLRWLESS